MSIVHPNSGIINKSVNLYDKLMCTLKHCCHCLVVDGSKPPPIKPEEEEDQKNQNPDITSLEKYGKDTVSSINSCDYMYIDTTKLLSLAYIICIRSQEGVQWCVLLYMI